MGSGGQLLWPVTESWGRTGVRGQVGASARGDWGVLRAFKEAILVDRDLGNTH